MIIQTSGSKPQLDIQRAKNLVVTRPSNSTVTITADEVVLVNSSGNIVRHTSVNVTIDITASGANGLDTGAEAANTIYRVWLISNGSAIAGLVSTSATAPTMPTGYSYKGIFSCVGNNNSSNFINFKQTGIKYCFSVWAIIGSGNVGTAGWTSIDLTPANLSTVPGFVDPQLSTFCFGALRNVASISGMTNDSSIATGATDAPNKIHNGTNTGSGTIILPWAFDVLTADTIYWNDNDVNSTVYLQGFDLNKISI